jgi:hypothetical protein
MKLVKQPPKSNCCGQACVATVAGISLEDSIEKFRKRGKTRAADVRDALKKCGFSPLGQAVRMCKSSAWISMLWESATLIVKFKEGKCGHWVVRHKGKFYDPASGVFREVPRYLAAAKPTSFVVVNKSEAFV